MSGPSPETPSECGSRRTRRRRAASQRLWRFLPRFYLPTELAKPGPSITWAGISNSISVFGPLRLRFDQFHIQSQALEFLDQDVEGFRKSGLKERFSLDDRLVHSRTSRDIV